MKKKIKKKPVFYSIGQRFHIDGGRYLLAMPARDRVCLVNLCSGNRFEELIYVKDYDNITKHEMKAITSECDFKLIK